MTVGDREVREVADLASGKLTRLGWSRLAAVVGGRIAQFDCNFETYGDLQALILRPDGERYHRESIGRVVRALARAGVVHHQRVYMGVKPRGAKWASARGTTNKIFNWRAVAEKNPMSRRQQRKARQQQAIALRDAGKLVPVSRCAQRTQQPGAPRYSTPPTPSTPAAPPADLAEAIEATTAALERRGWAAGERPGPVPVRSSAAERPPPD